MAWIVTTSTRHEIETKQNGEFLLKDILSNDGGHLFAMDGLRGMTVSMKEANKSSHERKKEEREIPSGVLILELSWHVQMMQIATWI